MVPATVDLRRYGSIHMRKWPCFCRAAAWQFGFKINKRNETAGLDSRPQHIREVVEASETVRLLPTPPD